MHPLSKHFFIRLRVQDIKKQTYKNQLGSIRVCLKMSRYGILCESVSVAHRRFVLECGIIFGIKLNECAKANIL